MTDKNRTKIAQYKKNMDFLWRVVSHIPAVCYVELSLALNSSAIRRLIVSFYFARHPVMARSGPDIVAMYPSRAE